MPTLIQHVSAMTTIGKFMFEQHFHVPTRRICLSSGDAKAIKPKAASRKGARIADPYSYTHILIYSYTHILI